MTPQGARYGVVAVALHWAIAAAIALNLFVGWWMHEAIEDAAMQAAAIAAFQLHKSVGLAVLVLTLLRLAWRLLHAPPPLPAAMRPWERGLARGVHWAFYGFMVAVPLSGWLYVSTQWREDVPLNLPTLWFGLFEVPHLFGLNELEPAARQALSHQLEDVHQWLAWSMAGLLGLHVAAALKHRLVDRDAVLASMRPGLGLAIALIVAVAIVAAGALGGAPAATAAGEIRGVPGGWAIDPASEIAFAGTHAGEPFRGRFTRWQADIRFDAATGAPSVSATVETGSATDGVTLHDETLPEPEWFDVARHPTARYVATRVEPRAGGGYTLEGTLTIKGRAIPVPALELAVAGDAVTIQGRFPVDREAANLGMESDASGEYVSRRIEVEVNVRATRP